MTAISIKASGKPTLFLWGDFKEKNDIDRVKSDKETILLFDKLIEEIYFIVENKIIRENNFDCFVQCLNQNKHALWGLAGKWCMLLTHYFNEFEQFVIDLMKHNKTTVRLHIVQSIWVDLPTEKVVVSLLKAGLKDTSKRVRYFSAERTQMLTRTDLLEDLIAQQQVEKEKVNREWLSNVISLVKDGYYLEDLSESQYNVVCKIEDGLLTFFMEKRGTTKEKIKAEIQKRKSSG